MQGHAISGGLAGDTIGDQHCSVLRGGAGAAQPPQNTVEAAGEGDEGGEGDGCDAGLAPREMGLGEEIFLFLPPGLRKELHPCPNARAGHLALPSPLPPHTRASRSCIPHPTSCTLHATSQS